MKKEMARVTVRDESCEGDSLLIDANDMTYFLLCWAGVDEDDIWERRSKKTTWAYEWKYADSMRLFSYGWHDKIKSRDSLRIVAILDALNCYNNGWIEVQYL